MSEAAIPVPESAGTRTYPVDRALTVHHLEKPFTQRRLGWRAGGPEVEMTKVAERMPVIVLYCPLVSLAISRCAPIPVRTGKTPVGLGRPLGVLSGHQLPRQRRTMPLCSRCLRRFSSGCDSVFQPRRIPVASTLAANLAHQSPTYSAPRTGAPVRI